MVNTVFLKTVGNVGFKDAIVDLKKQKTKIETDYSLRDAVFALNWSLVYTISKQFILRENAIDFYEYYHGKADLFALMLLSSNRLNCADDFIYFLKNLPQYTPNPKAIELGQETDNEQVSNILLIERYIVAAQNNYAFLDDIQALKRYKPQLNPKGLMDIETQIIKYRKGLLKEANARHKLDYQLFFLIDFGNTNAALELFEKHENDVTFYPDFLKIATLYAFLNNKAKAKVYIEKYIKDAMESRPFEPYLSEELLKILENTEGS